MSSIKSQIIKYGVLPKKTLGQNFLIDNTILKKIIIASNLQKEENVLEIGSGLGILTKELAKRVNKVIAVEKDKRMLEILKKELKDYKNIILIHQDVLKLVKNNLNDLTDLNKTEYKVIGNIPYYLTSFLIKGILNLKDKPKEIILMVQKEVAQRMCANPPKMNILSIAVQFYAKTQIIDFVSKNSFWPKPKVDSAIIKIIPFSDKNNNDREFAKKFFKIVRAGFSHPRKQLINNLSHGLSKEKEKVREWLLQNNVWLQKRAENISLKEWISLAKSFII